MSDNKSAKIALIKRYGAECFIEKLKLRKNVIPRTYKSKGQMKRMRELTYHHIKMRKDGGDSSIENGALLSMENHQWFHKQNEHVQGYMNALFQEYKRQMDECRVIFSDDVNLPFTICATTEFSISETEQSKEKYNRAKERRKTQKQIDEYYDEK